jgi:hypothetical protein
MKRAIGQYVHGMLFVDNGRATLLITDLDPALETERSIYLRFAFPFQGTEEPILPVSVLDDWGDEIGGLGLYEWVREFGEQFPRAELFGFDLNGQERQCFLRELELHGRMPCYAYRARDVPLSQGILVESIMLAEASVLVPRKIKPPPTVKRPLRSAMVTWWVVNSTAASSGWLPGPAQLN